MTESSRLGADLATSGGVCLTVAADDIEIDGDGHRISAGEFAISWDVGEQPSNVAIRNVVSSAGLQVFGQAADGNIVEDCAFGDVGVFMADNTRIERSRMTRLTVMGGRTGNDAQDAVIRDNEIVGDNPRLVQLRTTDDPLRPCGRGGHQFTGNHVVGTASASAPGQVLIFALCGNGMTISDNLIEADGASPPFGIELRDEADDNRVEDNTIRLPRALAGIFISSGSPPRQHPRGNTLRGNRVTVGAGGPALWVQAHDAAENVFEENLFESAGDPTGWLDGVQNRIRNNTFYNGGVGPALRLDDLRPPGNRLSSNIFAHAGTDTVDFAGAPPDLGGYDGDFNLFFNRSGDASFDGRSLAQWRSDTGDDGNSIEADPLFCTPGSGNFGLRSSSPARGAGEGGSDAGAFSSSCP